MIILMIFDTNTSKLVSTNFGKWKIAFNLKGEVLSFFVAVSEGEMRGPFFFVESKVTRTRYHEKLREHSTPQLQTDIPSFISGHRLVLSASLAVRNSAFIRLHVRP